MSYSEWLDELCKICSNLLKATVKPVYNNNDISVISTEYYWHIFIKCNELKNAYNRGWSTMLAASMALRFIVDKWEKIMEDEGTRYEICREQK